MGAFTYNIIQDATIPEALTTCFLNDQVVCTFLQTAAVNFYEMKSLSGLGPLDFLTYQSADGDDLSYVKFTDGYATGQSTEVTLSGSEAQTDNRFAAVCCFPLILQDGEGESR